MSLAQSRKAGGWEIPYLIFVVIFFSLLLIGGSLFTKTIAEKIYAENKDNIITQIINWLFNGTKDIPIVNSFMNLVFVSVTLVQTHEYLQIIVGALIGVPLAYIFLGLLRGGK